MSDADAVLDNMLFDTEYVSCVGVCRREAEFMDKLDNRQSNTRLCIISMPTDST